MVDENAFKALLGRQIELLADIKEAVRYGNVLLESLVDSSSARGHDSTKAKKILEGQLSTLKAVLSGGGGSKADLEKILAESIGAIAGDNEETT